MSLPPLTSLPKQDSIILDYACAADMLFFVPDTKSLQKQMVNTELYVVHTNKDKRLKIVCRDRNYDTCFGDVTLPFS